MTTEERELLDKFYTVRSVAEGCVKSTLSLIRAVDIQMKFWIEPSAGSGSFYDLLPSKKIGIDIAPEHPDIIQADFLTWRPQEETQNICVIGNPPFGKNSSLAVRFFNHAADFASVIAMILPRTFEKDSIQRRLDKRFHLTLSETVLPFSFELGEQKKDVPSVFQVWVKKDFVRDTHQKPVVSDFFEFTDKDNAFCAIQRVGANAGLIKTRWDNLSPSSHYFLRSESLDKEGLLTVLNRINFDDVRLRTAGNPSISKAELVDLFRSALQDILD